MGAHKGREAPHRIRRTLQALQARIGDREIVICRELTKIHEQLVKGPISTVLNQLENPRGEFTIIVELGVMTNYAPEAFGEVDLSALSDTAKLGHTGDRRRMTRRQAVAAIAKRHGLPVNQVYSNLERLKKSDPEH